MYYKDGKSANVQKRKTREHRNVLVFFFPLAMLVIPISQKLSLGTRRIRLGFFGRGRRILNPAEQARHQAAPTAQKRKSYLQLERVSHLEPRAKQKHHRNFGGVLFVLPLQNTSEPYCATKTVRIFLSLGTLIPWC